MLYYLKQEVIGEHAESVLKGADIRYLTLAFVEYGKSRHADSLTEVHCDVLEQFAISFLQGC